MQTRRVALVGFVFGFVLFSLLWLRGGVSSAQTNLPSFQFADTTEALSIERKTLDEPVVLTLHSLITSPLQLHVRVSDLKAADPTLQPIRVTAPAVVSIDRPGDSQEVTLAFECDCPPQLATYSGFLTVWDEESGTVLRKTLQLSVVPPPACPDCVALTPAVNSWHVTVYRRYFIFGGTRTQDDELPLKQPVLSSRLSMPKETTFTSSVAESDGYLQIEMPGLSAAVQSDSPSTLARIGLAITPGVTGWQPGVYKGNLSLAQAGASDAEKSAGAVALTVTVKDHWLLPALVLLAGIVVAWALQSLTGPQRAFWQMRSAVAQASKEFHDPGNASTNPPLPKGAKERFAEAAQNHTWAGYAIEADFDRTRKRVDQLLDRLRWRFLLAVDDADADYKQAQNFLKQMRTVVDGWTAFAVQLDRLEEAVAVVERSLPELTPPYDPQGLPAAPRFLAGAKALLLQGGQSGLLQLSGFADRSLHVSQFGELAKRWPESINAVTVYRRWLDAIEAGSPTTDPASVRLRQRVRRILCEIEWELWRAENLADLAERGTTRDLQRAERYLSQLNCAARESRGVEVEKAPPAAVLVPDAMRSLLALFRPIDQRPDAEQVVMYARLLRFWDRTIFIALLVFAIFAVMQQQYIGKAFGTGLDYFGLALWGLGAKVALEAVNSALGRVLASNTQP